MASKGKEITFTVPPYAWLVLSHVAAFLVGALVCVVLSR